LKQKENILPLLAFVLFFTFGSMPCDAVEAESFSKEFFSF
jgi:hypothetical protein